MTSGELGKCLGYLKAFYTNWNLDITNEFVLEVWFQALGKIEYQTFRQIVKDYCMSNKFGPSSPQDLLCLIPKTYGVEEAWDIVLDIISRASDKGIILNMLAKYPVIYKFMNPYVDDISNVEFDNPEPKNPKAIKHKCFGYQIGRLFKRNYQDYLNSLAIRYEGNQLVTSNKKVTLLEGGQAKCLN